MKNKVAAYGFFKPDALEDKLIDKITEFVRINGFQIRLLGKCRFTKPDVMKLYEIDWKNCSSEERRLQLSSNLENLIRAESYAFQMLPVDIKFSKELDLYSALDNLKGKAYDDPPTSIRSYFKTPFVENMSKDEEVYRISRNRIHLPAKQTDIDNLVEVLKLKLII